MSDFAMGYQRLSYAGHARIAVSQQRKTPFEDAANHRAIIKVFLVTSADVQV